MISFKKNHWELSASRPSVCWRAWLYRGLPKEAEEPNLRSGGDGSLGRELAGLIFLDLDLFGGAQQQSAQESPGPGAQPSRADGLSMPSTGVYVLLILPAFLGLLLEAVRSK